MSFTEGRIPSLYNGVSQQPQTMRSLNQCNSMVNCYPTIARGVGKRPPVVHVSQLTTDDLENALVHTINRDTSERYEVVATSGELKVYDLGGNEITVNMTAQPDYLICDDPKTDLAIITVADFTFIVNKTIEVEMDVVGADTASPSTDLVLLSNDTGFNPTGGVYRGSKQVFSDLPDDPANGDIWEIKGSTEQGETAYYVRRINGVWEETVKNSLQNLIKSSTMPHALVRSGDGTFEFVQIYYPPRRVGDEKSIANPSFVGKTLSDVFFYRNRLGFAAGENFVLSRAADFGNFFRATATTLLDDDVIDYAVTTNSVSNIKHAVAFDAGMMLFADQTQFNVTVKGNLTASTLAVEEATHYEVNTKCKPIGLGTDVYYAANRSKYSGIYEYFVSNDTKQTTAADITAHAPRFVPKNLFKLVGNSTHEVLFGLSDEVRNRIYFYKYFWRSESEKIQSAWSYWELEDDAIILDAEILDDDLMLLVKYPDGSYLQKINIAEDATYGNFEFDLLVDRRVTPTATYNSVQDKTDLVFPYEITGRNLRLIKGEGNTDAGASFSSDSITEEDAFTVSVTGDHTANEIIGGIDYEQVFEFNKIFIRDGNGLAVTNGRLQLRTMNIYFQGTAYFKVEVDSYGVNDFEGIEVVPAKLDEFTGMVLGSNELTLNTPSFTEGEFAVTVYGEANTATIRLTNDTHVDSRFQSAEWEGLYFKRR